jgi:disulfide bond formation protein DsbB
MHPFLEKTLSLPLAPKLLVAASLGSLIFALTMEYGFGLHPCVLCLWQRIPFVLTAIVAVILWVWKPYDRKTVVLLGVCAALYLVGMGLAVFHSGVERHFWAGTAGCAVEPLKGTDPESIRASLLQTVTPRCDEIPWSVFGLSMANFNILWSFLLALFAGTTGGKLAADRAKKYRF